MQKTFTRGEKKLLKVLKKKYFQKNLIMKLKKRLVKNQQKLMWIHSVKFSKQKESGQGLKILAPSQMLSRLLISLAELQTVNSSERLKNEIIQLLHSLYCSQNLTKQVYNHIIKHIWS